VIGNKRQGLVSALINDHPSAALFGRVDAEPMHIRFLHPECERREHYQNVIPYALAVHQGLGAVRNFSQFFMIYFSGMWELEHTDPLFPFFMRS
jgi:hypothetical protein